MASQKLKCAILRRAVMQEDFAVAPSLQTLWNQIADTDYADVQVTQGGGDDRTPTNPAVATFRSRTTYDPSGWAGDSARHLGIGSAIWIVQYADDHAWNDYTTDDWHQTIFYGRVTRTRATDETSWWEYECAGADSDWFRSRAGTAASLNDGPRLYLDAMLAADSLSRAAVGVFISKTEHGQLDIDAQGSRTNGAQLNDVFAGSTQWPSARWYDYHDGTQLTPYYALGPDRLMDSKDITTDTLGYNLWTLDASACAVEDVGNQADDYFRTIKVTNDALGHSTTATCKIPVAMMDSRRYDLDTFADSNTECAKIANRLMERQGNETTTTRIYDLMVNADGYKRKVGTVGAPDPAYFANGQNLGSIQVGDQVTFTNLPTTVEETIWKPWYVHYYSDAAAVQIDTFDVRKVKRSYDAAGGWTLHLSLHPRTPDLT
jgi:hypothetical protein